MGTSSSLSVVGMPRLNLNEIRCATRVMAEEDGRELIQPEPRRKQSPVDRAEWDRVRGLAERSMCAACTSLLYLIGFSFRVEGYMGYLLPLPIILMCVRHGVGSGWSTLGLITVLQTGER